MREPDTRDLTLAERIEQLEEERKELVERLAAINDALRFLRATNPPHP